MQVRQLKARKAAHGFEITAFNPTELMQLMVWANEHLPEPNTTWFMELKAAGGYNAAIRLTFYFDEANPATLFKTRWGGE